MKSRIEILNEVAACQQYIAVINKEYNNLDQYSMQGDDGTRLLTKLNKAYGKLETLLWFID